MLHLGRMEGGRKAWRGRVSRERERRKKREEEREEMEGGKGEEEQRQSKGKRLCTGENLPCVLLCPWMSEENRRQQLAKIQRSLGASRMCIPG